MNPIKIQILLINTNYWSSTVAPASVKVAFNFSASSLETFSFIVLGAPSTKSLASFNPNPVASLTTLITAILFAPASFNTTLNSVFSSAAAAPATGAATTAAAAADTPNFSSIALTKSANSKTVSFSISAIMFSIFSVLNFSF